MAPFDKILCALDFSPAGDAALGVARLALRVPRAPLALAHVCETPWHGYPGVDFGGPLGSSGTDDIEAHLKRETAKLLEGRAREGESAEVLSGGGRVHEEVCEHAAKIGADLIVAGTHGRGAVGRLLLGSVAEKLIRASEVPVVVVPEGGEARFRAKGAVVCPVDFSSPSEAGARGAASLAAALGGPLDLVYVEDAPFQTEHRRESEELMRSEAEQPGEAARSRGPRPRPRRRALGRDRRLRRRARGVARRESGTRGRRDLARALIGSVTDRVVRKSRVPVLVVPPAAS